MERLVSASYTETIAEALATIPVGVTDRLRHVDFLTGVDPVWVGLHEYQDTEDGRSYSDTAHCAYPWHTSDGTTTIVLPYPCTPDVVVHELGHALDALLGFADSVAPVSKYALVNRMEAFAESFQAWLYNSDDLDDDAFMRDLPTRRLFAEIAWGSCP